MDNGIIRCREWGEKHQHRHKYGNEVNRHEFFNNVVHDGSLIVLSRNIEANGEP